MRKIFILTFFLLSVQMYAQKTWSFYGTAGIGSNSNVALDNLTMSEEDVDYFQAKGIPNLPNFADYEVLQDGSGLVHPYSVGTSSLVSSLAFGVSRYFNNNLRVSAQVSSQYVNQSNYHAGNLSFDVFGGYDLIRAKNHELFFEMGIGLYNLWNTYYYHWTGRHSSDGSQIYVNGVPEYRECNLGKHNVSSVTVPIKVSYDYNVAKKHWAGVYAAARLNTAEPAFCPRGVVSAGVEYRYTLGATKAKKVVAPTPVEYRYIFVDRTEHHYMVQAAPKVARPVLETGVLFEISSAELTQTAKDILNDLYITGATKIELTGSTCAKGSVEYNEKLEKARLQKVKDFIRFMGYTGEVVEKYHHDVNPDPDWRAVQIRIEYDR